MRRRSRASYPTLAVALGLSIAAAGCTETQPNDTRDGGTDDTIVVGVSGAFPENQIVAELYAQVLEHAG